MGSRGGVSLGTLKIYLVMDFYLQCPFLSAGTYVVSSGAITQSYLLLNACHISFIICP